MTTAERAAAPLLPDLPPRRPDAPGQFAFADEGRVRRILEESGWADIDIRPIDVACTLPEKDWSAICRGSARSACVLQEADDADARAGHRRGPPGLRSLRARRGRPLHRRLLAGRRTRGGAERRRRASGRRMARTVPLLPPPQKNRSPPSDSSPDTPTPAGISRLSRTSPVRGSMRRTSLASPSRVACQSSPSTQVTPVTKRFESMVRRIAPGLGIDLMDLALAILPDPQRAFGPRQPRVAAAAGRRDRREHPAGLRIDLLDAILGQLEQVPAVERGAGVRGDVDRARALAARRIEGAAACRRPRTRRARRRRSRRARRRRPERAVLADDVGC